MSATRRRVGEARPAVRVGRGVGEPGDARAPGVRGLPPRGVRHQGRARSRGQTAAHRHVVRQGGEDKPSVLAVRSGGRVHAVRDAQVLRVVPSVVRARRRVRVGTTRARRTTGDVLQDAQRRSVGRGTTRRRGETGETARRRRRARGFEPRRRRQGEKQRRGRARSVDAPRGRTRRRQREGQRWRLRPPTPRRRSRRRRRAPVGRLRAVSPVDPRSHATR